jgi:hypothetical protein
MSKTASTPRSADQTRSPVIVSGKREYFNGQAETFGSFSLRLSRSGVSRRGKNLRKSPIGVVFYNLYENTLRLSDRLAGAGGFEPLYGGIKIRRFKLGNADHRDEYCQALLTNC